jgi:predicted membrane protein
MGDMGIMDLKTSNGNIKIKIPEYLGVMFNAHAGKAGKVIVDLPCSINEDMEYAGVTQDYAKAARKINITARTNLGRIEIT